MLPGFSSAVGLLFGSRDSPCALFFVFDYLVTIGHIGHNCKPSIERSSLMTLEVEVFWSFRSPYSYLATPRLAEIAATYDVDLEIRPVYPLAVRVDGFFKRQDRRWPLYVVRDAFRTAQMLGMPFGPPRPDPIVMDMTTGDVPKEQPYIRRLTHLGQAAAERGRALPFICEVSRLIWGGETPGWDQGGHLANAAER